MAGATAGLISALAIVSLGAAPRQTNGDPVVLGTWRTWRTLHSAILGEDRRILVHVPDDDGRTTLRYPVLFHLYGQQVTGDFADAMMAAERLGTTVEIPPLIVVGVANTDRYRDNLPLQSDGAARHLADDGAGPVAVIDLDALRRVPAPRVPRAIVGRPRR